MSNFFIFFILAILGQAYSKGIICNDVEDLNELKEQILRSTAIDEDLEFLLKDYNIQEIQKLWSKVFSPSFILRQMAESPSAKNETRCIDGISYTLLAISDWSIRMLDASGVPGTTGIFDGNLHAIGSYDECVGIEIKEEKICGVEIPDFRGRYALATLAPVIAKSEESNKTEQEFRNFKNSVNFRRHDDYGALEGDTLLEDFLLGILFGMPRLGLCVPSLCSAKVVEDSLNSLLRQTFNALKVNMTFAYTIGENNFVADSNTKLTGGDIAALTVLTIILLLSALGTGLDVLGIKRGIAAKMLICFSVYTNGQKLLSTKKTSGTIDCVNGIRLLSMCWVVVGHTWYTANFVPWNNPLSVSDIYNDGEMNLIFSATLAVDTFFLLSGFLMSYLMLKNLDKTKGRNQITQILLGYVHRYIRLTPAYGIIMLMFSTIALHVGSGPFWYFMINQGNNCAQNWWANLLYINNYIDTKHMCMGESWYLACDFQLFIIGPLLVWPMWKFPKAGVASVFLLLVASTAVPGGLTAGNNWPATNSVTRTSADWFGEFYIATYTRASPYIYGILFGYFMYSFSDYNRKTGKKIPSFVVIVGWFLSAGLCLTTVFGLKKHWEIDLTCLDQSCFNVGINAAYAALGRLAWSLGVSWVVFACSTGYGGIVNKFLSWSFLAPLSRLTFCIYLIHLHMMFIFHFGRKDVMEFEQYFLVYLFFGHIMMTLVFAVICTLLFESPFIGLEKIIFGRGERRPPAKMESNAIVKTKNGNEEITIKNNGISNPSYKPTNQET